MEDAHAFEDLLAAAQSGDSRAYRELWLRYSASVVAFLSVRGASEPDDLTSEVFLTIFSTLDRFRGDEGGLRALIFTVAHRRLIDDRRRRSRRPPAREWTEDTDRRRTQSAEESAMESAGASWARDLIDGLSPDQRDVMTLRIFGDLTVEQVATLLGKREGAVKALQRRALNTLRKKLAGQAYPLAAVERLIETT